jgi:hypothetical protein
VAKRGSQKLMLECQDYMESQRSKCIESINQPLYNIPPLLGSVQFVLASPDTEMAPPNLPVGGGPNSPTFILPHHDHFQVQLDFRGEWIRDRFCALNPSINSICP